MEVAEKTSLLEKHKEAIQKAVKANHERTFYAAYPEHPKAYGEGAVEKGQDAFKKQLNNKFEELLQENPESWVGEEVSPYTQESLGIQYPLFSTETLISKADKALAQWRKVSPEQRAAILTESLDRVTGRFFEIGFATMHTTGQSFIMSFQASGPHANDRALEAVAMGYEELTRFPKKITWTKPMGKFDINLEKTYKPIPKGIGLVIGCSTFPTWNTVPGLYASLVTGNPVIVKPHPKAVLPIAIVVAEIQKTLKENGLDPNIAQLAVDTNEKLITKDLAEHTKMKLIDYTGNTEFGNYIESLEPKGKTVFTEKAGVNSVILDSADDLDAVLQNLAFSISLYSGQMCTAPQNFFIPGSGVKVGDSVVSYDEVVEKLKGAIDGLVNHPKMGAGTLGAIQNPATKERTQNAKSLGGTTVLESHDVENPEFNNARTCSPSLIKVNAGDKGIYDKELFGPVVLAIKTKNTKESIALASEMGEKHGAITCAAYTTDENIKQEIEEAMESVFVPVSFNLTGFIWVNQHAAFSDFHVTGGNPAGNASFTNPEFITKRFVWVGHRSLA